MPTIDRDGNIIHRKKTTPLEKQESDNYTEEEQITDLNAEKIKSEQPQGKETDLEFPIQYDFIIHCATLTEIGMDMIYVCDNCPFKKTTCVDTMLLPDEDQMKEIAKILMRKNQK